MRLSINQYICPKLYPTEKFFGEAKSSGAEAVGLSSDILKKYESKKLKSILKNFELGVSSLNSVGYFFYNNSKSLNQFNKNLELIQYASEIEAQTICIITGGIIDKKISVEKARNEVTDHLSRLSEIAKKYGTNLGLEIIHPVELPFKGCINSIKSALDIISIIPNLNIIIDFFHSWWDPDLLEFIEKYTHKISLIQFCNIIELQNNLKPSREIPLDGLIDTKMLLNKAKLSGYNNFFEFEIFYKDLRGRSVEKIIKKASEQFFKIHKYE